MEYSGLDERVIHLANMAERRMVEAFLKRQGLELDKDVEYTVALMDDEKIAAVGSFGGNVLKCIAIDHGFQGMAVSNRIVSNLISEEYHRGRTHLFIFTKPAYRSIFEDLGFYMVEEVPTKVILLENLKDGITSYINDISRFKKNGAIVSSIVVNCNPFTLGHQYLIEKASIESDILHVFVVWEDKSSFPNNVRYELVKKGTAHLQNVIVHKGKDYIISNATFPSYFLKDYDDIVETHANLDLNIFGKYIVPALGINRRYVGEEPYCKVTGAYNTVMKKVLPQFGVKVIEIPRLENGNGAISASLVREMIKNSRFDDLRALVPESTYEFIKSPQAEHIVAYIMQELKRH